MTERLLDHFRDLGLPTSRLEVRTENRVAIDLYTRLGFRIVGLRPGYYDNGGDAFVMAKSLPRGAASD
jgi:ribosomal-protein-alanine N-acetyltransferase